MKYNKTINHIDRNMDDLIKDLQILIKQPSISAKNEGIDECSILVSKMLNDAGISSEILRLNKKSAPLVFGEVKSKSNPSKTLLFYNHYDVQPIEPIEEWIHPPFSGKRIGNKIFGRGSSDDKGELITRIKAVEAYLKEYNDVPCNIKFCIEGEEENGSENIIPVKPNTIAKSIAIGNPADGYYGIKTANTSGGYGEDVSDKEVIEAMKLLAETEGIFTETAGGVTVGVTKKLVEQGRIKTDETTVICITGNGLKTQEALADSFEAPVVIEPKVNNFEEVFENSLTV